MGRPRKCWSKEIGTHGSTVVLCERVPGGPLSLRWWVPAPRGKRGQWKWRALRHRDREAGEKIAREVSAALLAQTVSAQTGVLTVTDALSRYTEDVAKHLRGHGPKEAERRADIWTTFLGGTRDCRSIDFPLLDRFCRDRRAGRIVVPDHKLAKKPSNRTLEADLVFLVAVLNHCTRCVRSDGTRLLAANPVLGYQKPSNANPRRPVATYDRYLKLLEHADKIDPLFPALLTLAEEMGWRISALCALRASDVDRSASPIAPHGTLRKRPETDKEEVAPVIPLSPDARSALDKLFAVHAQAGRLLVGEAPLFPAPRAKVGEAKSWDRYRARTLLQRCEKAAKLPALEGTDWHGFRRGWATSRKHLPDRDVAHAGGWKDLRSLQTAYQQTDAMTVLSVMLDTTRVRDVKAVAE